MKKIYREQLKAEGYGENSEVYKGMERFVNTSCRALQRERAVIKESGIKICTMSKLLDDNGSIFDSIPTDEDIEERILHEIELDALRECISELPVDDQELLIRVFSYGRGGFTIVARESGIPYQTLYRRVQRIIKTLRKMMIDRNY